MDQDFNFLENNEHKNILFDILFNAMCAEMEELPNQSAHYKIFVAENVDYTLRSYYMALALEQVLTADVIEAISFNFSEEYNDNGGIYLTSSINLDYITKDGENETEQCYDVESIPDHVQELLTEKEKNAFNFIFGFLEDLGQDDISKFYESSFSESGDAMAAYSKTSPIPKSLIDKFLLEHGTKDILATKPLQKPKNKL